MNSNNNTISSNNITNKETHIEIPLNVIKEKVLYCLPQDAQIEDSAVEAISLALEYFMKKLASKIPIDRNDEKKILIKDIKTCIENETKFSFLKKLIEK
jgi:hypothetical protein